LNYFLEVEFSRTLNIEETLDSGYLAVKFEVKCLYNKITNNGFLEMILNKVQNVTLYILYTNIFGCSIIRGYFDTFQKVLPN